MNPFTITKCYGFAINVLLWRWKLPKPECRQHEIEEEKCLHAVDAAGWSTINTAGCPPSEMVKKTKLNADLSQFSSSRLRQIGRPRRVQLLVRILSPLLEPVMSRVLNN